MNFRLQCRIAPPQATISPTHTSTNGIRVGSWLEARDSNASNLMSQHGSLTTQDNVLETCVPKQRLRLEGQLAISAQATRPGCVNASPRRRRRCPNLLKMLAGEIPYSPSLPQHPQEESMAASSRVKKRLLNIFDGPVDMLASARLSNHITW